MTLTLAGDHKVSGKQNVLASLSHILSQLIMWKFGMVMKQLKLKFLIPLFNDIFVIREVTEVSLTLLKKKTNQHFNISLHSDSYKAVWFKLSMMIDTFELYILIIMT